MSVDNCSGNACENQARVSCTDFHGGWSKSQLELQTPIHDFLKKYANLGFERCHMPGHKGINNPLATLNCSDITEIDGAIDIIKESERNAAELFGAARTLFSCSGSTLAISAMLASLFCFPSMPGQRQRLTAFRNAHRSLTDAAILLGFNIDWIFAAPSLSSPLTADLLEKHINSETAAVFATSIDYYGNTSDIRSIAEICDRLGLPLLVDNAHGAYLVFTDFHPIKSGAAMSADSAHKTLPALTGAAYLHIANDTAYSKRASDAMNLFGTSSPSYLILESLDLCNLHIANEKNRAETAFAAVARLKKNLVELGYSLNSLVNSDLLRITINANAYGYSGAEFAGELRNHRIVCEMYDSQYVILLFSTITEPANTRLVLEAMKDIPRKQAITENIANCQPSTVNCQLSPRDAYFSPKRTTAVHEAIGEVCAGVHVTLPPCAPLVIPGEIISREAALTLEKLGIREVEIVAK